VATWNLSRVHPTEPRAQRLREYMPSVAADIWILTETWDAFTPGPNYRLVSQSAPASDRDADKGECWVAIWTRLNSVVAAPIEADQERQAAVRVRNVPQRDMLVIGTVLPWNSDPHYGAESGAKAFRQALTQQAAEWQRLQGMFANSALCVGGDFNQDLACEHYYGSLTGKDELRQVIDRLGLECLTAGIRDPLAVIPHLASVDHLCVSGSLRPSGVASVAWPTPGTLDKKRLTDHYGVYTDIHRYF
jgi:hypothetical protein